VNQTPLLIDPKAKSMIQVGLLNLKRAF